MPTVTRENIGLLNDKLIVTVNKEDYLPNYEKSLKNYSKNANLPGFRKGMVPTGLVKKMYGQSVFTDEVLKTVEKGLFDYLETEKVEIFAQPVAMDENDARQLNQNEPKDYTFGFEIGLKPEFQAADLAKAKLTEYKVIVTDEMINNEIERLQSRHGKMTEPETIENEEFVLNLNFTACDATGVVAEGTTAKDNSLLVKYFTAPYQKQLIGKKNNDELVINLKDAFADKELEWVMQDLGLDAKDTTAADAFYKIVITKVGLVTKRELNEEFFKEVYPNKEVKTEAELRDELKAEIGTHWGAQSKNQLQDSVYHYLVDHTTIDFPESFLKKWMQTGREKQYTAEEVALEYPQFTKSLKWTLISDSLTKAQQLKVVPDEIKDFAKKQVMGYMGITALDESHGWVEEYANKMMNDKKFVEDTYHRVITEKLFDWAVTQVKTTEKEIDAEAFAKLQQDHKH